MGRITKYSLALVAALAIVAASCSSSSDDATPSPTDTAVPAGGHPSSGLSNEDIETMQRDLDSVGCFAGSVDGIFGPNTKAGLEEFQRAEGLAVDGLYGPQTQAKLTEAASAGDKVCTSTPTPSPTSSPTNTAPCTADAITAAAKANNSSFVSLTGFQCDAGFAVGDGVEGSDGQQDDYTIRLQSVDGAWQENDNCSEFPQSLQSSCNTN